MIFDDQGFPKDNGASDWLDSARLAGLMAIVNHPQTPDLSYYVISGEAVRHPTSPSNNVTRDQLMPLVAGLYKQGHKTYAELLYLACNRKFGWGRAQNTHDIFGEQKPFWRGRDILTPAHMLVMAKACGKKGPKIGYLFVLLDIIWASYIKKHDENNQLISMLFVLGPNWLKLYKLLAGKNYEIAIRNYWENWRNEPELAQMLINI